MDVSKILSRDKGLPPAVPSKLDKPTVAAPLPDPEDEFENEGGAIVQEDEDDEWVMNEDYIKPVHVEKIKELLASQNVADKVSMTTPFIPRHKSSARFHELLAEIGKLHDSKQKDYGTADDPFANVRAATEFGLPAPMGAFIAMKDNMNRIISFCKNGRLEHDSLENALMDMAVYSLIALVLFEEENGTNAE